MSVVGFRRENTQTNVDYWGDRCCKAEAEIERLRAALDMIMRDGQRGRGLAVRLADTARAALSHQQQPPVPDIDVRCACGWKGKQSQLDEEKRCPECTAIFNQFPRR